MDTIIVFCPQCQKLILNEDVCPQCGWHRPPSSSELGSILWRDTTPIGTFAKPYGVLVANEEVVIGSFMLGRFPKVEACILAARSLVNGKIVWQERLPQQHICYTPVLAGGLLLVATENIRAVGQGKNVLIALDVATGQQVWTHPATGFGLSAPAVANNVVFFTTNQRRGYALALQTGQLLWEVNGLPAWSPSAAAVADDGSLWLGSRSGTLAQISKDQAITPLRIAAPPGLWLAATPLLADNILYTTGSDQNLYAIDSITHKLLWKKRIGRGVTTPPAVDKYLYVGCKRPRDLGGYALVALNRDNGRVVWEHVRDKHIDAPPIVTDGVVIAGCRDGHLIGLDAADGMLLWEMATETNPDRQRPTAIICQPVTSGNHAYVGDRKGNLYAAAYRASDPLAELPSIAALIGQGRWQEAGIKAVAENDWHAAAGYFARAALWYEAAQLYDYVSDWLQAGQAYEAAERYEAAAVVFEKGGDMLKSADMWYSARHYRRAAEIYARQSELEKSADAYLRAGMPDSAIDQYYLAGNMEKVEELLRGQQKLETLVSLYQSLDDIDNAVRILLEVDDEQQAAELLITAGRIEAAAQLYESEGLFAKAAALWLRLHQHGKAARLFERAGQWQQSAEVYATMHDFMQAGRQFEQAGMIKRAIQAYRKGLHYDRAQQLMRQLKDLVGVALLYEQQDAWVDAANTYLAMTPSDHTGAARCYEQVKMWQQAAYQHEEAHAVDEAIRCWQQVPDGRQIARLLARTKQHRAAAQQYEQLDEWFEAAKQYEADRDWSNAARCYRESGNHEHALALLKSEGAWQLVAKYAADERLFEQAADAWFRLAKSATHPNDQVTWHLSAAQAFEQAAGAAEQSETKQRESIAGLWDKAALCYEAAYEDQARIAYCLRAGRRLRELPEISVSASKQGTLYAGEWHPLFIKVHNHGFGIARTIHIKVANSSFDGEINQTHHIRGLRPEQEMNLRLNVKPQDGAVGSAVPLILDVSYQLPNNTIYTDQIRGEVEVRRRESGHFTRDFLERSAAPQTTIVHGDVVYGMKQGDVGYQKVGQVGGADEVSAPIIQPRTCPECGTSAELAANFCTNCQTKLPK